MVNVCVCGGGGGGGRGEWGRKSYQPGVYVPLKALCLVFLVNNHYLFLGLVAGLLFVEGTLVLIRFFIIWHFIYCDP